MGWLEARAILDTDKIDRLTGRFKEVTRVKDITELTCGASLAHHGLLGSLGRLGLRNVDLSPVPAQRLASLVSCVTRFLDIENVSGCDLVSILTNIKCEVLTIYRQSLWREETQALVQTMESRVKEVKLWEEVTLDIEAMTEYSGQGQCNIMKLAGDSAARYREVLRTWARSKKWRVQTRGKYDIYENLFVVTGLL